MYTEKYFPFLDKSPILRREKVEIDPDDLFFNVSFENYDEIDDDSEEVREFLLGELPEVYQIEPLDILVMNREPRQIEWYKRHVDSLEVELTHLDYHKIARYIEVDEGEEGNFRAFYPSNNGFLMKDVNDTKYIKTAKMRMSLADTEDEVKEITEGNKIAVVNDIEREVIDISEALDIDSAVSDIEKEGDSGASSVDVSGMKNKVEANLEAYLTGNYTTDRVPLLAGPTAVLKSVTVKDVARKHGFRMVDFRAAFMDRLDLEGLMERVEVEGNVEAFNAGMFDILECTDSFIDFCNEAVDRIDEKINDLGEDESGKKEELEELKSYYEEKTKPAVLFFDEITRADSAIMNALTTILNQKEFLGHEVTKSKIVAATNLPIGLPDKLKRIYGDVDIKDVATADRFETIDIVPEDVEEQWLDWIKQENEEGKSNIHPVLVEFLEKEENAKYRYNYDEVAQMAGEGADKSKMYTTPFPNYRTWEIVSDYIYKKEEREESKKLSKDVIENTIGSSVIGKLQEHLEENGYELYTPEPQNKMDDLVDESVASNTPIMLIGPSSIGKTARVKNMADKHGVKPENIIKVNLAQQDSIDIMGPPTKVDLASYVGGHGMGDGEQDSIFGDESEIGRELRDMVKNSPLPEKATIKAPKTDLASKVRSAMENREPMIIFFDEFNRVEDDSVMTAVFEAVSDGRIFGVNFDPDLVTVVCAANVGKEYRGAEEFDPAFAARFNIFRKDEYDLADVKSFKQYMKKNNYNEFLQEFINSKEDEEVLEIISSIDERTLEKSVPSMRAFNDLNMMLEDDSEASKIFNGTIIFSENENVNLYTDIIDKQGEDLAEVASEMKDLTEKIKYKISNWSALNEDITVEVLGQEATPEDLIDAVDELYDRIFIQNPNTDYREKSSDMSVLRDIIVAIYSVDNDMAELREDVIGAKIGDLAGSFTNYYNTVSGTDEVSLEIEDLKDKSLIGKFLNQKLSGVSSQDDKERMLLNYCDEFMDVFDESLSQEHYQEFIRKSLYSLDNMDARMNMLVKMTRDQEKKDRMVVLAEENDNDFIREVLGDTLGKRPDDEEIEDRRQSEESKEDAEPKILK